MFLASFTTTLLVASTVIGLAAVDFNADDCGFICFSNSFSVKKAGELSLQLNTPYKTFDISLENANNVAELRHQAIALYSPRLPRLIKNLAFSIKISIENYHSSVKEEEYKNNAGLV